MNESREKVRRYIRLTYLIPELLNYIDNKIIYDKHSENIVMGVSQGVEFSYLTEPEQKLVAYYIEYELVVPSHGHFNKQKIEEVLPFDLVKRDKRYIEAYIIEAIKEYKKKNV